jgi:hypothetical protein
MRCKADLVHGWTIQPFTFTSIAYLKKQRDRGAPWESRGRSAAAALWLPSPTRQRVKLKAAFKPIALKHDLQNELLKIVAWMPIGKGFRDEFLLSIKLKCLSALWLPSPTRQSVKLKANFKKATLKARYKIAPTTVPALTVGRGFSPTKHIAKTQSVAINDDLQKRLKLLISPCAKLTLLRNVYFAR